MAVAEVKSLTEQKKLIIAIALGVAAIIALWWTFIGFGGGAKTTVRPTKRPTALASPATVRIQDQAKTQPENAQGALIPNELTEINYRPPSLPLISEARRNIFAFYVPPPPPPRPTINPAPSPTPTPPVLLASISPSNVYARTDDFTLEVTGDKFTPAAHILIDGRELQTHYVSPQQMSTTVTAALIANAGQRQVTVRSSDGKLYSNPAILNVTQPPTPNYTYVGIIGKPRHIGDTALLQDKNSKEILSVQRGDVLGGRFRITSISDRELVVVDTNLKIKHTLPLTNEGEKGPFAQGRPTPKVAAEDDEP